MLPPLFLTLVLALTAWAFTLAEVQRRRRHALVRQLAARWEMLYSPRDTLDLTGHVAELLPLPGAAEVVLHDLVYGSGPDGHVYYLSVVFTVGALGHKSRVRRVVLLREASASAEQPGAFSLALAPTELAWLDQYEALKEIGAGLQPG